MNTRDVLTTQGYTFHAGHISDDGIFHFTGNPANDTHIGDLTRMGFVKVKGGIMEPQRQGGAALLAIGLIGAALAGMFLISKSAGKANDGFGKWITR